MALISPKGRQNETTAFKKPEAGSAVHLSVLLLAAATNLIGCRVSSEPEPAPSAQAIEIQTKAKKAAAQAELHAQKIIEVTKSQVPIPDGPRTILFTADMDDLDRQIMEGK